MQTTRILQNICLALFLLCSCANAANELTELEIIQSAKSLVSDFARVEKEGKAVEKKNMSWLQADSVLWYEMSGQMVEDGYFCCGGVYKATYKNTTLEKVYSIIRTIELDDTIKHQPSELDWLPPTMPKHNVIEPYSDGVGGTMYDYVIHFAESKTLCMGIDISVYVLKQVGNGVILWKYTET